PGEGRCGIGTSPRFQGIDRADGTTSRTLGDADEFARTLSTDFLVPLDDLGRNGVARLWSKTGPQDDLWRARVTDALQNRHDEGGVISPSTLPSPGRADD
ncbi:hypothetical protein, partial [Streptosporangium sp. NPDC023615]|uniref:hypothetical protein n=1 Tax=Streptosporangium sp. NPDC023615 TaxID=3154794 RepID=UPI0034474760